MAYSNFDTNGSTPVKFLSGTQEHLTPYIKGTTQAEEGAFYLTTDTQKLYVGRKNTTDNKVYAVQVSRGVTFVATSGDLPAASANDIEEGELYYITNSNVLAALIKDGNKYKWTQVNPPTGIKGINTTAALASGSTTDAAVNITISSQGDSSATGKFHIASGNNISITTGSENSNTEGVVTIAAKDTLYDLGTTANTSKGIIKLSDNNATPGVDNVELTGSGLVKVTSDANGAIAVAGPTLQNIIASPITSENGFNINLNYSDPSGSDVAVGTTKNTKLDPIIAFGQDSSGTTTEEVHFVSGTATLPVYTKTQTDTAIDNAVKKALRDADALTFKGVVTSGNADNDATSLMSLVGTNGARNGDVYKVGANPGGSIQIGDVIADIGDLIIINGTEGTNGQISYTNINNLLAQCELVPSGDEPELTTSITTKVGTSTSSTGFNLQDGKNGADLTLLNVQFKNGTNNNILISGERPQGASNDSKQLIITANHPVKDRTNTDIAAFTAGTGDDIGSSNVKLYVLGSNAGLSTDTYGHVTGFQGKLINFRHNRLSSITPSYSNRTISLAFEDTISGLDQSATLNFASDTLHIASESNALKMDLTWGTF